MIQEKRTAVIIGAGPAGLTAALELCRHSSIRPIVLEGSNRVGGIACTVCHNGNRMDMGGHRFFSKSDRVMDWWTTILPISTREGEESFVLQYQNQRRMVSGSRRSTEKLDFGSPDCVMLVRPRKSRIYCMGSFFDYPFSLSGSTLRRLGPMRAARILLSYVRTQLAPQRPEKTLEDFFINRFGRELYLTFFKSYTEKVWGMPCTEISAAWGAQRIKGLSLWSAVTHWLESLRRNIAEGPGSMPKEPETSLIERFLYPKQGPGQLWEKVAGLVEEDGGEVRLGWSVKGLHVETSADGRMRVGSVEAQSPEGRLVSVTGDYFFSTMPVRELLRAVDAPVPEEILAISDGLVYRNFITVGLLVDRLLVTEPDGTPIRDNWIYIQEPGVQVGRIQIFNNWSSALVADPAKMWIGLEYFCKENDALWNSADAQITQLAIDEAAKIGILKGDEVRDACVHRVPKAYPAYCGTYERFDAIIDYMERFENLFLVGRNGMHRYNNQDHSMLTAMLAVENILAGVKSKRNLWEVNTELDYHEEKAAAPEAAGRLLMRSRDSQPVDNEEIVA